MYLCVKGIELLCFFLRIFFSFFFGAVQTVVFLVNFFVSLQSISNNDISIFSDLFNTDLMTEYGLSLKESGSSPERGSNSRR
jgi:hypothetical protein